MPRQRRRRLFFGSASSDAHAERPWVYFMVDCFFLIAQFFIISFNMRVDQYSIEGKIPKGTTPPGKPATVVLHPTTETIQVHVYQKDGQVLYMSHSTPSSLSELKSALQSAVASGHDVAVRISYEGGVPWHGVMDVMNFCSGLKIKDIGFQPLRATDAHP